MLDLHTEQINGKVVITDINMPFGSMVRFMVKATLAAIPAALIVAIVVGLASFFLTTFLAGLGSNLRH